MPKKFIKRLLPDPHRLASHSSLRFFGKILHEPNLWHLNRRSATGAFAVGLFFAFWPVPFQMWLSAAVAIPLRVNLPLSVATVWITNPFTMPPIFYAAYRLGVTVLGTEIKPFNFELSWTWLGESLGTIGPAFLVGCSILSLTFGLLGYLTLSWLWRFSVRRSWHERKQKRLEQRAQTFDKNQV